MAEQDQDTRQREKRVNQTEQHDESVLNPEIKDELDLSKKERRLIEKEKLKGMGMKKKLEYIWMYYKPAIFGVIAVIALAVLYFLGRRLEKRQVEQQQLLEMSKQTVSMLVIDKKKMKIKDSGLPKIVYEQTPKYMRWAKVPVVKAKVGPKVMTLMADERVFASLPVKTEAKVVVSGLYITEIKSVRGGAIPQAPKKKGFFARFKKEN